ncbi:LysM domain protein [Ceratobasidium sp. AG-Ba]|nr:LysM domain protein [Ceratobasidium sp. AG-Ba]QRW07143.1 LysM domain protein [Ceratobasidium sp. AG-Ba]
MFSKVLVFSALASVAFAAKCTRTYTVQPGDWCDSISRAQNVSTYQLSTVNADKINDACTNLEINQVLCLGTEGQDCNHTHNVVAGDSCDKVMSIYNINATMLYTNNPQIDEYCSNMYIGEVLCVANTSAAPESVPDRFVGAPGGQPAGPPATVPYPEAKPKKKTQNSPASSAPASTSTSSAAPPAPTDNQVEDDEDDSNLPECEDPNDDGY